MLLGLGFDAIYDKTGGSRSNRNAVKSARREALRLILQERWGPVETEWKHDLIRVPDLADRQNMSPDLKRVFDAIEAHRGLKIDGQKGHRLCFDMFVRKIGLVVEFDERQHFTPLRAASLKAYPSKTVLGFFDKTRWIRLSEQIRAGDNSPIYRDEQRAFYDSIRDILALEVGLRPVIRIFEEDVAWEKEGKGSLAAQNILVVIGNLLKSPKP